MEKPSRSCARVQAELRVCQEGIARACRGRNPCWQRSPPRSAGWTCARWQPWCYVAPAASAQIPPPHSAAALLWVRPAALLERPVRRNSRVLITRQGPRDTWWDLWSLYRSVPHSGVLPIESTSCALPCVWIDLAPPPDTLIPLAYILRRERINASIGTDSSSLWDGSAQ